MREFPAPAKIFYWAVVAAAIYLLVVFGTVPSVPLNLTSLLVLALLIVADVFADAYHIHLGSNIELSISSAINFAAMVLFGGTLGAIVGGTGSLIGDLVERKVWYKVVFNVPAHVLPIFISGQVYQTINDGNAPALSSPQNALALGLAGMSYIIVNTAAVGTMLALVQGHSPLNFVSTVVRPVGFQMITLIPLGTLFSLIYYQNPWGLILLLFPIALTQYSFENYNRLRAQSQQTIELLAEAVDERDAYTFRHSSRVGGYAEKIGRHMGMDMAALETLSVAARMHDLGKIGIPSSVLLKPGKLTPEERKIIEEHPLIGARILGNLSTLEGVRDLIAYHHERIDGRGYPSGLMGDKIPLGARILAVADSFEAMTADRPYRKGLSSDEAIAELERGRNTQFDNDVVDHFLAVLATESAGVTKVSEQAPLAATEKPEARAARSPELRPTEGLSLSESKEEG